MIQSILVLTLLISHSITSFADSNFQALGAQIPRQLVSAGYSQFGALNLNHYLSEMSAIQIRTASEDEIGQRNKDGRKSARWEITANGRTITYDPPSINMKGLAAPILALHEFLGILRYSDSRYIASLGMWFLTRPEAHRILQPMEIAQIVKRITRTQGTRMAGGVIGIGGGGQRMTVEYRAMMMLRALEWFVNGKATREAAMGALMQVWLVTDEVTYERGPNPKVDFSHTPSRQNP